MNTAPVPMNHNVLDDNDVASLVAESEWQLEGLHHLLIDTMAQPRLSCDAMHLTAMLRPVLANLARARQLMMSDAMGE